MAINVKSKFNSNYPNVRGYKLESLVKQIYENLGYPLVKSNVFLYKRGMKSQIDLVYLKIEKGFPKKVFVEMKYKGKKRNGNYKKVTLDEIAKFKGVLDLVNHNSRYSEMITNSDFNRRARFYARMYGINLINGEELYKLYLESEYRPKTLIAVTYDIITLFNKLRGKQSYLSLTSERRAFIDNILS